MAAEEKERSLEERLESIRPIVHAPVWFNVATGQFDDAPTERELQQEFDSDPDEIEDLEALNAQPPEGWDEETEKHIEAARSAYYSDLGVRS